MQTIQLKYGKSELSVKIPKRNLQDVLHGEFPSSPTPEQEVAELLRALRKPIGAKPLREMAKPGMKVVIMASDITRPSPTYKILPVLVDELNSSGVRDEDITVLFGMGIHRAHTPAEHEQLVGSEIYKRVCCIDSTSGEYVSIGVSSRGTPYNINKQVFEADLLICTGNVEYHWFAGYSGGAKALMPGAANKETIQHNHSMISLPGTGTAKLEGNPLREDIDEIGKFVRIDYILNVVLDENKHILRAFAGHYIEAHRAGCAYLDSIYSRPIEKQADIVLISCSGYPKDINIYQAQKALDNANFAVRDGGTIVMVGACQEGYGEENFERWVEASTSPQSILDRIQREFELGGHKAAAFAKVLVRADIVAVTELDQAQVERLYLGYRRPEQLQELIGELIVKYGEEASVLVIPQAGSIFPKLG